MDSNRWGSHTLIVPSVSQPEVAILVKNSLSFSPCGFEGARVCGATVQFRGEPLVLVSAYIRHTTAEGATDLSSALNRARTFSPFVYVGLDSNGHSPLWGPADTRLDRVGEIVEGVLCEGSVWVVNSQDSRPHIVVTWGTHHG